MARPKLLMQRNRIPPDFSPYLSFGLFVKGKRQARIRQNSHHGRCNAPEKTHHSSTLVISMQGADEADIFGSLFGFQYGQLRSCQIQWIRRTDRYSTGRHAGKQAFNGRQAPFRLGRLWIDGLFFLIFDFLISQQERFAPIKDHELNARIGKYPNQRGSVSLPQRFEAFRLHNFLGNSGQMGDVELCRRHLIQNFYPVEGRHDRLGNHARQSSGNDISDFLGPSQNLFVESVNIFRWSGCSGTVFLLPLSLVYRWPCCCRWRCKVAMITANNAIGCWWNGRSNARRGHTLQSDRSSIRIHGRFLFVNGRHFKRFLFVNGRHFKGQIVRVCLFHDNNSNNRVVL